MALSNKLKNQVDIPVWEWCRFAPNASAALSSTCTADNSLYHVSFGRYIYFMNSVPVAQSSTVGYSTGFFRYDTVTDTYQVLSFPWLAPATYSGMQFAGGQGYSARVISSGGGNNTIQAAAFTGKTLKGFDIRITGGTGAGQHRVITNVSDPVIAYAGTVTTLTATPDNNVIDANANWAINQWVGYQVRYFHSSGQAQTRKIIYNSTNTLYIADLAKFAEDQWAWSPVYSLTGSPLTVNAVGTPYQIESSTITVDMPWITPPDETSRFVVRSGGIWLASSGTVYTLQYYDIAADQWYVRNACVTGGPVSATASETTIVNSGENATVFERGVALGTQSTTNLQDTTKNWVVNQWAGYSLRIHSGTGDGKIMNITSNTVDSLNFWPVLSLNQATVTTLAGASGSYIVTLSTTTVAPIDCNGQSITGTNIGAGAKIVSGQGTTTLVLSVPNSDIVSGPLVIGTSATGNNLEFTITTSLPTPQACNGWTITGTNIATNATIVSGQGTTSLVLSLANTGAVSGIISMAYKVTAATGAVGTYVVTTGTTIMPNNCNGWTIAGTGIGTGATIVSGQGTNSLVLSLPNTASVVGSILTLSIIPDNTSRYFIDAFEVGIVSYVNPPAPKAATTVTATAGAYNSTSITLNANAPFNCNGWTIAGTGITDGTTISSGQGTNTLVLSNPNLTGGVSGILIISPSVVTLTATTGSLINTNVVTLVTVSAPANCNGWYVSGAGVGRGATVVSGQGGLTLTLSMFNTATMTGGSIYLYPTIPVPTVSTLTYTGSGTALSTSPSTVLTPVNCNGWYVTGTNIAVGTIVVSGQGTNGLVLSLSAGAINGLVTLSPTIATATAASGAVGTYIVTTNAGEPITPANCNGWYISGTGIGLGAVIVSGQGTKSLTLSIANTATVSAGTVLTLSATAVSTGSVSGAVFTAGATTGAYYPGQILLGTGVQMPTTINTAAGVCSSLAASLTVVNFAVGNPATMGITVGMGATLIAGTGTITAGSYVTGMSANSVTLSAVTTAMNNGTVQFGPMIYLTATSTGSAGPIITITTNTNALTVGMYVTGTSITNGTYITQINSATTFTVSQAPTAMLNATIVTCTPYQTMITSQLSGVPGGAGTYSIFPSQGTYSLTNGAPSVVNTTIIGLGNSVLVDNSKNWPVSRWNNQVVRIKSGTANGDYHSILATVPGYVTYTSGTGQANSVGTLVTLDTTVGLAVGMVVTVTTAANTGVFVYGTTITAVNNSTQFTVSVAPSTVLASATVVGSPVNTLVTYSGWNTVPDSNSRYVIHGDPDKLYMSFGGQTPTFIHNIEADTVTMGRMMDYGVARGTSAQYSDHPPVALLAATPSLPVLPIVSAVGYIPGVALTGGSVTSSIATVTNTTNLFPAFPIGSWITVAGITGNTTFNGTWQVIASSAGSVSFYSTTATAYGAGGTVAQANSIVVGGNLASGAYSNYLAGTNITISGCVPVAYNGTYALISGSTSNLGIGGGYQSAPGVTNALGVFTIAGGDVAPNINMKVGMIPTVTAGVGNLVWAAGTYVSAVGATTFTVTPAPAGNLGASAVITVVPTMAFTATVPVPGNLITAGVVQKVPITVTSGAAPTTTVTLGFAAGTTFAVGSWVVVSGATPAGYNGVYQVVTSGSGSITYVVPVSLAGVAISVAFGTVAPATTTQLVNTVNGHSFKAGQYITHRGDTSFSAVYNNVTAPITPVLMFTAGAPIVSTQYTYPVAWASGPMINYAQATTQLCDMSKNWLPNQWAGCIVTYNFNQFAVTPTQPTVVASMVIANTSNTLIFAGVMTGLTPSAGVSRYVITPQASSPSQNSLGCVDSGITLGAQLATQIQDTSKAWVSPGGTVGIPCTGITTALYVVTVPLQNAANIYAGMQGLILSSSTVTFAAASYVSSVALSTGVVTMVTTAFTGSGSAIMTFGYGVTTCTSGGYTATLLTTVSGLYVGMQAAVAAGTVTLAAGTTITVINTSTLTVTLSNPFGGATSAATLTFTAPCSSSGNTVTVSGFTTAGLAVGMYVGVISAANHSLPLTTAGAFTVTGGTNLTPVKVTSILNATQFMVSATPAVALSNATVMASFWIPGQLVARRVRVISGVTVGFNEATITSNNHNTLTFATITNLPVHGVTGYSILQQPVRSSGTALMWNFGSSNLNTRGIYLYQARGGAANAGLPGWDRFNLTTDKWEFLMPTPSFEGLTAGAMYAYDGADRIYFTTTNTNRVYYLDIENMTIHGASQYPYLVGLITVGNRMEIFETADGLKYLWLNRNTAIECFKQLLFY